MSHTYAQNGIHVVFSTKDRRKVISAEFSEQRFARIPRDDFTRRPAGEMGTKTNLSGNPTYQASGSESVNTTALTRINPTRTIYVSGCRLIGSNPSRQGNSRFVVRESIARKAIQAMENPLLTLPGQDSDPAS